MLDAIKANFMRAFLAFGSFMSALVLLFVMATNTDPKSTDSAEYLGSHSYAFTDAIAMGQGITTDGEYFYTSGTLAAIKATFISKVDMNTGKILMRNDLACPAEFINIGMDHIGGISYYNGYIYASLEGKPYDRSFIILFNANDLSYSGKYFELPKENHPDGVPWIACDAANGCFYTGAWNNAARLNVYDIETGEFIRYLDLNGTLNRIQGAEVFDGILYTSSDDAKDIKNVYAVDLATGDINLAFTRNISKDVDGIEAEGMTITLDGEGNLVFHVLDYDKVLGVFIRSYKLK